MRLEIQVWSFVWDDAGGPGLKLFPTRESLQAYMHNQIAGCESEAVQRLLTQNRVEEAFRLWESECDESEHRYEWDVHELDYPISAMT
jgi:hypothetical protein